MFMPFYICMHGMEMCATASMSCLFLLWVMTGKKEGKSRVNSQGPFSGVAPSSPSALAC